MVQGKRVLVSCGRRYPAEIYMRPRNAARLGISWLSPRDHPSAFDILSCPAKPKMTHGHGGHQDPLEFTGMRLRLIGSRLEDPNTTSREGHGDSEALLPGAHNRSIEHPDKPVFIRVCGSRSTFKTERRKPTLKKQKDERANAHCRTRQQRTLNYSTIYGLSPT
jgi:hypothetical protein